MIVDTGAYVLSLIMVLTGCIVRDFIIPLFVWRKHLRNKSYGYRFWFCVITQAALQINLVLLLGLFNILNVYTFTGSNLVIYLLIIWNYSDKQFFARSKKNLETVWNAYKGNRQLRQVLRPMAGSVKKMFRKTGDWPVWKYLKKHWFEAVLLTGIAVYNIWFLTHNVMFYHSYQFSDIPVHQSWIYGLEQGKVYSNGIYPFGMHIMVYFIRILFGFNLREILLYAGAYQFVIVVIGVYLLAKKIFSGKYTPMAAILILSFMLNQGRYAASLPQEAGMYAVIAIAYFMISYLHEDKKKYVIESDSRIRRFFRINSYINRRYIHSELILMMLSVALVISYHYFTAIATVFVVISIGLAYVPKIFKKQYFVPLMFCGMMGALIAIVPIGAALVRGIRFEASINWATTVMSGEEWEGSDANYEEKLKEARGEAEADDEIPEVEEEPQEKPKIDYSGMTPKEILKYYYDSIYNFGSSAMFGSEPTKLMFACMLIGAVCALIMMMFRKTRNFGYDYTALIIIMVILYTFGASQALGIPELIAAARASTFAQPFIGLLYMLPFDFILRIMGIWKNRYYQMFVRTVSLAVCVASAMFIMDAGWYHNFFDVNQAYYNEPEYLVRNIKKSFEKYSYTIVATTDEYYEVLDHGRHTEISKFMNMVNRKEEEFTFTTDYVFFFIEKTLLQDYTHGRVNVSLEYAAQDFVYMAVVQDYYYQRAIVESQVYYWAEAFQKMYPRNFKVYFENDIYIVYLMEQNTYYPYSLQIDYLEEYRDIIQANGW